MGKIHKLIIKVLSVFLIMGGLFLCIWFTLPIISVPKPPLHAVQKDQLIGMQDIDLTKIPSDRPYVESDAKDAEIKLELISINPKEKKRTDEFYFRKPKNAADLGVSTAFGENGDSITMGNGISASSGYSVSVATRKENILIEISSYSIDAGGHKDFKTQLIIPYLKKQSIHRNGHIYQCCWKKLK